MQLINPIRWLKDVVEAVGGTTPIVQIEVVRQPHFKKVHISFQVPIRNIDFTMMTPGEAIPMVSIDAVGGVAPNWVTYERLAMEACLHPTAALGSWVLCARLFILSNIAARGGRKQYYSYC
jgi:hypothetical protein